MKRRKPQDIYLTIRGRDAIVFLDKGLYAVIDAIDIPLVKGFIWHAVRFEEHHTWYARSQRRENGRQKKFAMHQLLFPGHSRIDHRDGDGLNNRRSNLRPCTISQNGMNRHTVFGSSRFLGVTRHRAKNRWQAQIKINGKNKYLGLFENEADAAKAYDRAAASEFKEFAHLNFGGAA